MSSSSLGGWNPDLGGGIRETGGCSSSGRGGGGGADVGGSLGALRSPWISRLRPPPLPPPPRSLFLPAAPRDGAVAAGAAARSGGAVSTHESSGRRCCSERFRDEPPPPPLELSSCLPSFTRVLRQRRGSGAEQVAGRGEVAPEELDEGQRNRMVASFGPFHVTAKRPRLLLSENTKQQQDYPEGTNGGRGRGAFAGRGNHGALAGDGCFPLFQRMARGEVWEVTERYGREEGFPAEDEGRRAPNPPDTAQRSSVNGEGYRHWGTFSVPLRRSLCKPPNQRTPSDMGSGRAAGYSQIIESSRWLHRHRRGENHKRLDYHPSSSSWPLGNGSIMREHVSASCAGPRGVIEEASSRQRLLGRHPVASAHGAAYEDNTNDTATTRTSYDIPHSTEVVQQRFVLKSSFWNIERIGARVVSPFCPPLALDEGGGRKRILDPDVSVTSKSQKLRTRD